jgi:hypothetical protein
MSIEPKKRSQAELISERIYERFLALYPLKHRRDYGALMAQLFRDQCRDAYRQERGLGLVKLWGRVLPDLATTAMIEHAAAIRKKEFMFTKLTLWNQRWLVALGVFVGRVFSFL